MENKEKKSVGFPVAHTVNLEGWMVFLAKQVDDEGGRRLSLCELKERIKSVKPKNASVQPEETEEVHHKMFVEILGMTEYYLYFSNEKRLALWLPSYDLGPRGANWASIAMACELACTSTHDYSDIVASGLLKAEQWMKQKAEDLHGDIHELLLLVEAINEFCEDMEGEDWDTLRLINLAEGEAIRKDIFVDILGKSPLYKVLSEEKREALFDRFYKGAPLEQLFFGYFPFLEKEQLEQLHGILSEIYQATCTEAQVRHLSPFDAMRDNIKELIDTMGLLGSCYSNS